MPFAYSTRPHARKHGPSGYAEYTSYKPWLRDDEAMMIVVTPKLAVVRPGERGATTWIDLGRGHFLKNEVNVLAPGNKKG